MYQCIKNIHISLSTLAEVQHSLCDKIWQALLLECYHMTMINLKESQKTKFMHSFVMYNSDNKPELIEYKMQVPNSQWFI